MRKRPWSNRADINCSVLVFVSHSFDKRDNKLKKYICTYQTSIPLFVFSPLSLNAKLVGSLYECLAPAEGEVRGCITCFTWVCVRVCVVCSRAWLHHTSQYVVVYTWLFLLRTSTLPFECHRHHWFPPAHLVLCAAVKSIVSCFIICHFYWTPSPLLFQDFAVALSHSHSPCFPFFKPPLFHVDTQPVCTRLQYAWLHSPPACFCPVITSHLTPVSVYFTLLCTGSCRVYSFQNLWQRSFMGCCFFCFFCRRGSAYM